MKLPMLPVCLAVCAMGFVSASAQNVTVVDDSHVTPKVLHDAKTNIDYYLESDGRHISAISPDGKLLWSRNPFVDAKLGSYRTFRPIICYFNFVDPSWWKVHSHFGPADDFIGINFNSTQFGVIKKQTGDFIYFGED